MYGAGKVLLLQLNLGDVNIEKRQMIFHAFATWKNKKEKVYDWAENGMLYMLGKSNYKMLKLYKKSTSLSIIIRFSSAISQLFKELSSFVKITLTSLIKEL